MLTVGFLKAGTLHAFIFGDLDEKYVLERFKISLMLSGVIQQNELTKWRISDTENLAASKDAFSEKCGERHSRSYCVIQVVIQQWFWLPKLSVDSVEITHP